MNNQWESLLDILELPEEIRSAAELTVLRKFPSGDLEKNQLLELAQEIKNHLNIETNLTIIACHYDGSFQSTFINLNEIEILWQLWMEWAGNYIIILPNVVNMDIFYGLETDTELIKFALIYKKNLLLKSCDGYELFHVYISN